MASGDFPHLHLAYRGQFTPKFASGPRNNHEVDRLRADAKGHASRLRATLDRWVVDFEQVRREREKRGLPAIPAETSFVLRVPEGSDGDAIAHALGINLVAETSEGLMLVATADLSLTKLREVIDQFELSSGRGQGGELLEVFTGPEDPRRLEQIFTTEALKLWPFVDGTVYTFDLAVHSTESTRRIKFSPCRRREAQGETEKAFAARREALRQKVREDASEAWHDMVEARFQQLNGLVSFYAGAVIDGPMNHPEVESADGLVFPDSFQVRVRMTGAGFKDVVQTFVHLFEVAVPSDVAGSEDAALGQKVGEDFVLTEPDPNAPAVCVIDSGIQEEHRWLAAAIDRTSSYNFVPGEAANAIADQFPPRGHGTRVAGAVLYPAAVPKSGTAQAVAWIQNARVLNAENKLPEALVPERYLAAVVDHFACGERGTRIFNHSINSSAPCRQQRMSAWAAKIDQLSHQQDVLFIQSIGNLSGGLGTDTNPGLRFHRQEKRSHPDQLFQDSSRVANPGQALHALTVGSIAHAVIDEGGWRSFAVAVGDVSGFSRAGYAPPWDAVKPEVVEYGGDYCHSKDGNLVRIDERNCVELLSSTLHGEAAHGRDGAGTSYAAPKVAHIAARLQTLFPEVSPLLYRALIVQSARWPQTVPSRADKDHVLRTIGYGLPEVDRATLNTPTRVTLITEDAREIAGKQFHLFVVRIPEELRKPSLEASIRVDVTLAYTAEPRRTRARNRSYLETWLDWECSRRGEPIEDFRRRLVEGGGSRLPKFPWVLDDRDDRGDVEGTNRTRGSVQKDWATFPAFDFPEEFAIAVRGHLGWNHRDDEGKARYCLAVSFEAVNGDVEVYEAIRSQIRVEPEVRALGARA